MVLGDSEPISGAGLELPHNGFRVLLQPERTERASRPAKDRAQVRESMRVLLRVSLPVWRVEVFCVQHSSPGQKSCENRCRLSANMKRAAGFILSCIVLSGLTEGGTTWRIAVAGLWWPSTTSVVVVFGHALAIILG